VLIFLASDNLTWLAHIIKYLKPSTEKMDTYMLRGRKILLKILPS